MKILNRYVVREHVGPLLFSLAALTSLLLLNYVAKQFANLVGKGLPWSVIAEFFLLAIPFTIAMTLPMAVLVATIYAFSRLASENEVTAMKASGVRLHSVLVPVLWCGAALSAGMVLFNDQVLPRANHRLRTLQTDIARKKPTFGLREQIINEVSPGRLYLRASRIDASSNLMYDVTIFDLADPMHRRTVYADSGDLAMSVNMSDLQMRLYDGYMQEVSREHSGELQRVFYTVNNVRVRGIGNSLERSGDDGYKGDREQTICELQEQVRMSLVDVGSSRRALAREMRNQVKLLTTGVASIPPDTSTLIPPRPVSLGRMYCAAQAFVLQAFTKTMLPTPANAQSGGSTVPTAAQNFAPEIPQPNPTIEMVSSQAESARIRHESAALGAAGYDVEIQKKFALSLACLVFVLFGAPIALRFPRGGVGLTLGVSLVVFSLYYVGLIAGESLAGRGALSPFMAMWGTDLIFAAVGLSLQWGLGGEQTTARGGGLGDAIAAWRDKRALRRAARA